MAIDGDVLLANRLFNPESNDSVIISYLYDADGELFGMEYNGNGVFAYTKNLQGDIVGIIPLDNESTADVGIEYDAWGYPHYRQGSSIAEGFLIAVMAMINAVGYRGYFFDMDTRLYYLRSGYYDPETGRFINADDTNYLGYDGSPLSLNLFAYCCNNPVNYIDYYGYRSDPFSSLISNFKSDKQGQELLRYYLYGNGKKQNISSKEWTNYLNANNAKMCKCSHCNFSGQSLKIYIWNYINKNNKIIKEIDKLKIFQTKTIKINKHIKASLSNGEGIIGYNYLHGVNMNVGGLEIQEVIIGKPSSNEKTISIKCVWHDILDPNFHYQTDKIKAKLAKLIPGAKPKNCEIAISWSVYIKLKGAY